ncbi:hypothetical protein [Lactobacillus iners]|uniref:hypothetical protein n=1 Tax=Lactobacillus iners TaxID=147802 RepID=UPI0001E5D840|nr:hypothetical protein [Lactobacillus iners]EFO68294.1 hypothetical protein HMPREF9213_0243 [Lactobacillus iners LactinV 09V1-c]MCT7683502.1 RNA helicase [Lactobacillus iners]MCT7833847.1 RNA helicase [Lactobacillus iners]MCT7836309.1 RNA helicase [Lactobacillus iners]MCT7893899.1 RNA helicase [Lactobacillus iners]
MKKLIIMLDYISGPLWKDIYDTKKKELVTGIDVVDDDEYIQNLNDVISDLYSSYYKINYNDEPVYFDKKQEKKDKYKMLDLLGKLIKRLDEVNDGSFEIDDRETERFKNL